MDRKDRSKSSKAAEDVEMIEVSTLGPKILLCYSLTRRATVNLFNAPLISYGLLASPSLQNDTYIYALYAIDMPHYLYNLT